VIPRTSTAGVSDGRSQARCSRILVAIAPTVTRIVMHVRVILALPDAHPRRVIRVQETRLRQVVTNAHDSGVFGALHHLVETPSGVAKHGTLVHLSLLNGARHYELERVVHAEDSPI
jgi:hypothetical protein